MTQLHELLDVFDAGEDSSPTTEGPIGYALGTSPHFEHHRAVRGFADHDSKIISAGDHVPGPFAGALSIPMACDSRERAAALRLPPETGDVLVARLPAADAHRGPRAVPTVADRLGPRRDGAW